MTAPAKLLPSSLITATSLAVSVLLAPAYSQTTSLRNPYIQGAQITQTEQQAVQGQLPPVGSGPTPIGVPAGMSGSPAPLQWVPAIPADQIDQPNSGVNLGVTNTNLSAPFALGQSLLMVVPHAPSTPGTDPGLLPGHKNYPAPAAVVKVNADGGKLPDNQAPTTGWGGQPTHDFGLARTSGSLLTDFGQPLTTVAATAPQENQDGPRPSTYPGEIGSTNLHRLSNFPNSPAAQECDSNPDGGRCLFKGPNNPAQMTIAPY